MKKLLIALALLVACAAPVSAEENAQEYGLHTQEKPTTKAIPHFKAHQEYEKLRRRENAGAPPDTNH